VVPDSIQGTLHRTGTFYSRSDVPGTGAWRIGHSNPDSHLSSSTPKSRRSDTKFYGPGPESHGSVPECTLATYSGPSSGNCNPPCSPGPVRTRNTLVRTSPLWTRNTLTLTRNHSPWYLSSQGWILTSTVGSSPRLRERVGQPLRWDVDSTS
jgi:hypothetical protein